MNKIHQVGKPWKNVRKAYLCKKKCPPEEKKKKKKREKNKPSTYIYNSPYS